MNAPLEPTNEGYALAKICSLKLAEYANKQHGSNFINLMPCNLFGPGDHYDSEKSHVLGALISRIYQAKQDNTPEVEIWGTGNPRREFLYIDDLIDGMIWSANNLERTDTFLNMGTGIDISIKELAEKIAELIGYDGSFTFNTDKPDGMIKKCLDVTKMKNLGWEAKTSFDYALEKSIFDYIDTREKTDEQNRTSS
jgi:GDP-L-fucose synthase